MAAKRKPNPPTATITRLDDGRIRANVRGGPPGAAYDMAQTIARVARSSAPKRTGRLRANIHAESTGRRAAVARSDASYSRYQDEGAPRAHVRATHYFTRAVTAARQAR